MKRATENRGNIRTLPEYFSPRNKVKNPALQERSLPNFTSSLQETPMKPSQVPNQLCHSTYRKMFPPQGPELCNRDRPGPPRHSSHHTGTICPSWYNARSPANIGSPANRLHLTERDRVGRLHHSAQPTETLYSQLAPVGLTNSGSIANRPQPSPSSFSHPVSPQFVKDSSKDSLSNNTLCYSESTNVTRQRQDLNKAQPSNVRSSMQTVQLHRPHVTLSLNTKAAQEVCQLPQLENWSPCNSQWSPRGCQSSLSTQSSDRSSSTSVSPCQDQTPKHPSHKQRPSSEQLITAVDFHHISQRRSRQFEDCGDSAKKLCLRGVNSGNSQMPKSTVDNSSSTSLVSQPSLGDSPVLELSPKTTDSHPCKEPGWDQSISLELSSTFKPTQSSCTSMGARQAYISSSHNQTLRLKEISSSSKHDENVRRDKTSSLLSSDTPQKDTNYVYSHRSTSVLRAKTLSRGNQEGESKKSDIKTPTSASKPISGSLSCRKVERNKPARHKKRPVIIPDDINDLFTPDPMTYVVSHKNAKPKINGGMIQSSSTLPSKSPSEKSCSSSFVSSSSSTVTASSCLKKQNLTGAGSPHAGDTKVQPFASACQPQVSFPTVTLKRIKLENLKSSLEDSRLKKTPATSTGRLLKNESVKSKEKHASLLSNNARPRTLETDTAVCEQTSTPHCSQSPLLERQASDGNRKKMYEEEPIDVELDLVQSYILDLDKSQSSHSSESSEEEQLISLKEMMEHVYKPLDTPEKGTFSEPSTPGHHSFQSKTQPLPSTTRSYVYKNNLDQMLKEINDNKKTKEIERQLLNACKEDLLRIAEYEEAEENRDEGISTEHQEFLQRYSLMSNAIREVPPGEVVFNLENFGRIFNQDSLQLRQCMVSPQGTAQKTLLWSSPAQLRLNVNIGLFQEAYDCCSPCPTQVTRFLFKMMSVHNERMVSEKILQALCDIACTAACQIVKNGSQQFNVWVPSLADVALVLMNMGIAFVTLFPFENLQPSFTEGDLLEDINIGKNTSNDKEKSTFPEHNCNNILKYLSYCMDLCPRAYSDNELLLLLTVLGRVGLDTRLILQSSVELYPLQYKIVSNIRDWDAMLPRICLALTDLTDDHHNMCLLVQTLPDNTRGKQLRRHLSLAMISKLLDGKCSYRPTEKEIQLSELRPYLPRMQPSTLLRSMLTSSRGTQKVKEDMASLDQQAYYLCYSLLTLANEASKFQFFPAHQKEQLLVLSSELETHVKCDIRESEKCLYRSKVKDLVARIYTKWQMLLQRTRPLNGKLYDYWQPLPVDTSTSSQEAQEIDTSDDDEGLSKEEIEEGEEEENSRTEENDDALISEEKEEGDNMMDEKIETGDETKPEDMEGDDTMDDTNETEEAAGSVSGEINSVMPEMEPLVHMESVVINEQVETGDIDCTQVETENLVETKQTSEDDQVAVCDTVS